MELNTFLLSVLFISILLVRVSAERGFSIPIVHINSPIHPLHDSNVTIFDESTKWSAKHLINERTPVRYTLAYIMEIHIGTPYPKKKYVSFDSGSDLLWVQCDPCSDCPSKFDTPFRPSESQSYRLLSCDDAFCRKDDRVSCLDGRCIFEFRYLDGSSLGGELGSDTFSFSNAEHFYHSFTNVTFGCAQTDRSEHDDGTGGLIGLGLGSLSFVSQLEINKFSYCMPPPPPVSNITYIRFGSYASTLGKRIPFSSDNFVYNLKLDAITFGFAKLSLAFLSGMGYSGLSKIVLDSGTTLTWLHPYIYDALIDEFEDESSLDKSPIKELETCYKGNMEDVEFFTIVLHFQGGVDLELSRSGLFQEIDGKICLLVRREVEDFSILGLYGQINQNVGYDLVNKEISFYSTNCQNM